MLDNEFRNASKEYADAMQNTVSQPVKKHDDGYWSLRCVCGCERRHHALGKDEQGNGECYGFKPSHYNAGVGTRCLCQGFRLKEAQR